MESNEQLMMEEKIMETSSSIFFNTQEVNQTLCVGLLLGVNLVATAPTLGHAMVGWSLFSFASTFLIGAYNDRSTVRNNATFEFAAYRISDFALLVAATFAHQNHALATAGLILAAFFKSSQFPLTSLFVRSMEEPTLASALTMAQTGS